MEQMIELAKVGDDKSIVLWIKPSGGKEFVVCSYYDEEKPMGSRWCWGHYFTDLYDAVEYAMEVRK